MGGMTLGGVAIAVALLSSSATSAADRERPDGVRACATRGEVIGPLHIKDSHNLRIGPVVFFGLGTPPKLNHYRGRDPSLKVGIAVRTGAPVLLRIPREARRDIAFEYAVRRNGSFPHVNFVGDGQHLVRIEPCPPSTRRFSDGRPIGNWTAFPGGFVMRAAGCYPIEVARRGKPFTRRRIGFGKSCQKS
jgi:hypothetical protein